jgi:hypothetical protein
LKETEEDSPMIGTPRAAVTLLATAVAGVLLWLAAQFGRHTTGSYWAAYAVVAGAGLVLGLAQMRGRTGHPPAMLLLGFLPVLVAGGWVLLAMQPHATWSRNHVLAWSGDIHVQHVVRDVATWLGVIAFGIGYTLGAVLEPAPVARRAVPPRRAVEDRDALDAPTTAERREVAAREATREREAERVP